jgi:tripartite ATP-independent transporter DctP family solute receptor
MHEEDFMKKTQLIALATAVLVAGPVAAAPVEVRIASHVSEESPLYSQSTMFRDAIAKRFPDKFKFNFYPNGQLGDEKALIDNIKIGSLEMICVASGVLKLDKKLGLFDLPWLFKDRPHVQRAMKGGLFDAVVSRLEERQGFIVLGVYENGFRHVVNAKRPIRVPADMKGLKIRVTGSAYKRDGFVVSGANPVPVAWTETFTALQTGVVDGAEAALYGFYEIKLYEAAPYLSLTNHTYSPSFLIASKAFWDKLTPAEQKTFRDVADQITGPTYEAAAGLEDKYLVAMKKSAKVNEVDLDAFTKGTQSVFDKYTKAEGTDWLDLVNKAR